MRLDASPALTRRGALAALSLLPALLPSQPASALFGGAGNSPTVEVLEQPELCQGRAQAQDFVAVRYTGRFADGRAFDTRYAARPLVYQLGSFYLPGVDAALAGRCVGTKLRLQWASSPRPRLEDDAQQLPAGSRLQLELELVTIKYSLFGETMRDPANSYFFAPGPVTLSSAYDPRGHASGLPPQVKRDNPFALGPTEDSLISNSKGVLKPFVGEGVGLPEAPPEAAGAEGAGAPLRGSRTGKDG